MPISTLDNSPSYAAWIEKSVAYEMRIPPTAGGLPTVARHPQSWRNLQDLAGGPYATTFLDRDFGKQDFFRRIETTALGRMGVAQLIDLGIDGFLLRSDAMKLYEIAFCSQGDVLELGTHRGLSTSIIACALEDRGAGRLETVDIDEDFSDSAQANLRHARGRERVTFKVGDAGPHMDSLIADQRKFGFIFVDHWHGYTATNEAAKRVPSLLEAGGFVLFHDFLDPSNADPEHVYGVFQGVLDEFYERRDLVFYGNYGCCGLFRKDA